MGDKGFLDFCFFDLVLLFVLEGTNLGYIVIGECAKAWTSGESLLYPGKVLLIYAVARLSSFWPLVLGCKI